MTRKKGYKKCNLCGLYDVLTPIYYKDERVTRNLCKKCLKKDYEQFNKQNPSPSAGGKK